MEITAHPSNALVRESLDNQANIGWPAETNIPGQRYFMDIDFPDVITSEVTACFCPDGLITSACAEQAERLLYETFIIVASFHNVPAPCPFE